MSLHSNHHKSLKKNNGQVLYSFCSLKALPIQRYSQKQVDDAVIYLHFVALKHNKFYFFEILKPEALRFRRRDQSSMIHMPFNIRKEATEQSSVYMAIVTSSGRPLAVLACSSIQPVRGIQQPRRTTTASTILSVATHTPLIYSGKASCLFRLGGCGDRKWPSKSTMIGAS